ncbi:multisubstrate pseudouridine synthase 7 [Sparganum proliferum]
MSPPSAKRQKVGSEDGRPCEGDQLSECEVGISSYVSVEQRGFSGSLKGRWEDFVVHEIENAHQICKLTSIVPIDCQNGNALEPPEDMILPIEIDEVLKEIDRETIINSNTFSYAGTKDKRAITTQRVSVKNISSKRLASLNPRLNGIKVGNFAYLPYSIALGDLYGNRFSVAIRDVVADDGVIHRAIMEWQKRGFINYFGLQRFGHSAHAQTFEIGKYLIKSDWEKAIDLILKPTPLDLPAVRQVKEKYLETQDAKACGDNMPQCLEKTLLLGIARHGKTLAAIQTLPRNMRQLYTHSYQSLVWNRVTSRRISELGFKSDGKAISGDLFFPPLESTQKGLRSVDSASELFYEDAVKESSRPEEFRLKRPTVTPSIPSVVSSASDGDVPSIYQVVLPLPGYDVIYPQNEAGKWYSEILEEDKLKLEDLRHKVKDFALPGSYRHLVVKPEDVHYTIREYTDPLAPLIESDLKHLSSTPPSPIHSTPAELSGESVDHDGKEQVKKRAVVLEFTLPKAAYATMAIRELMKDVTVKQ